MGKERGRELGRRRRGWVKEVGERVFQHSLACVARGKILFATATVSWEVREGRKEREGGREGG